MKPGDRVALTLKCKRFLCSSDILNRNKLLSWKNSIGTIIRINRYDNNYCVVGLRGDEEYHIRIEYLKVVEE